MSRNELEPLITKLVGCYDELTEVTSECAFHLEALGCLALHEEIIDEDTSSGVQLQGAHLKHRLRCLKASLKDAIHAAKNLQ